MDTNGKLINWDAIVGDKRKYYNPNVSKGALKHPALFSINNYCYIFFW